MRLLAALLFAISTTSHAQAMSLAANYVPITRSEFVAGLVAVGMKEVSKTELVTPAGYRLNLNSGADFRVSRASLENKAFNGYFESEHRTYHISTFDDPDGSALPRLKSWMAELRFEITLTLEPIGGHILWISRDLEPPL